jgi:hypothetical protein
MTTQDDVYIIPDDDVVESLRKDLNARRQAARAEAARSEGAATYQTQPRPRAPAVEVRLVESSGARPFLAATLSFLVCGAGQALNGQVKLGAMLFLVEALAVAATWSLAQIWPGVIELGSLAGLSETRLGTALVLADAAVVPLLIAGVYQAYRRAEKDRGAFEGFRNPLVAGLASTLLPGWGQIANAQPGKAAVFLIAPLAAGYAVLLHLCPGFARGLAVADPSGLLAQRVELGTYVLLGTAAAAWILGVYDAVLVAVCRRRHG